MHDLHHGEMTVRETLDFSAHCLGVGTRYEMLKEISRREREAGIKPDPEIDAFMKVIALLGQKTNLVTDYVLKVGVSLCLYFKVYEYYLYASILFTLNVSCHLLYYDRYLDWIFVLTLWLEMR